MAYDTTAQPKRTSALAIALAWIVVGIPAAWGIYNTGLNAKKLFTPAPAVAAAPATPAAPAAASH